MSQDRFGWPGVCGRKIRLNWGIENGQNTEEDVSGGVVVNSAFYKEHGHVSRPSFVVSPIGDYLHPIRNTFGWHTVGVGMGRHWGRTRPASQPSHGGSVDS